MATKNSRRLARELALQGVYERLVAGNDVRAIGQRLAELKSFDKADRPLLDAILEGVVRARPELDERLVPYLDRPVAALSPVEHAVLLVAAYELVHRIETPYRVVINEAVELAKSYGGTDGHKYVNGVLDRLAADVRAVEVQADRRGTAKPGSHERNAPR
jgi:N utilization substance protein B